MQTSHEVTQLLANIKGGNHEASEQLIPLVYQELRRIAGHYMRQEQPGHTLQATALVHEAYLKLAGTGLSRFENRAHFFTTAAQLMRWILLDHARKSGGAPKAMWRWRRSRCPPAGPPNCWRLTRR
jgi:RNA polymerase sigma factor (TIGR02999 family)